MKDIKLIVEKISSWYAPRPQECIGLIQNDKSKSGEGAITETGYFWTGPLAVPPLTMYLYLKHRFGAPNGVQNLLKKQGTADNLIHWEWQLHYSDHLILITGHLFSYSILISNINEKFSNDKDLFFEAFAQEVKKNNEQLKELEQRLEQWYFFLNPYYHLSDMIEDYFSKLKSIQLNPPILKRPDNKTDIEQLKNANDNLHQAFATGTIIKVLIPIWIESFISLILTIATKTEIKKDNKKFNQIKRDKVLKRILNLPTHCVGFKEKIKEEELSGIISIFKNRNRILHGGINPLLNTDSKIYYDNTFTPILDKYTYAPGFLHQLLLEEVSINIIEKEIEIARNFFELILSKMEPIAFEQIVISMNENILGWNEKDQRAGCVLPPLVDSIPIFE